MGVELLEATGRQPFVFQAECAALCVRATRTAGRILVQAPTGSGKTLIALLSVAISARQSAPPWRGLLLVPTRPLVRQHLAEAGWLREVCGIPVHFLGPEDSWPMWDAVMRGPGLICTTPQSLRSRLERFGGLDRFPQFNVAIFDEIDVFLTVELDERRDVWPVLQACLDLAIPVLGFTGTALDNEGEKAWTDRGFARHEPAVPEGWLPFTRVVFQGVRNPAVVRADARIDELLRAAYRVYEGRGGNPKSWREIKLDAKGGPRSEEARRILVLHFERLRLFEGDADEAGKLSALARALEGQTAVVLSRFIESAERVAAFLSSRDDRVLEANGSMTRNEVERRAQALRVGDAAVLVITRELGGRGLDFPSVDTTALLSPRASYQAVAQELARIRSRRQATKTATVLYYEATAEAFKAYRLASHLLHDNVYRGQKLFGVEGFPEKDAIPERQTAHLVVEESLDLT